MPDAFVGAMQQAGRHREAVVGGAEPFEQDRFEHRGQALAAVFGGRREREPAAVAQGPVGLAKAGRRAHLAVDEAAAHLVARAVDRRDDLGDELAGFVEHLRLQRIVELGERRERAQARRGAEHGLQQEAHFIGAGLVVHRQAKLAALSASPPV